MSAAVVDVIVPTFRRPALLGRAIESVRAQTHPHWRLQVIDDNDADSAGRVETAAFMDRYAGDPRVHYHRHERNRGLPAARNTAIGASSAPIVAFLDDDDTWLPTKLAAQVAVFDADPDVTLVYTGRHVVGPHGRRVRSVDADPRGSDRAELVAENLIATPSSVACRRDALAAVDGFDERLRSLEDWDLYLRLPGRFAHVAAPLIEYHLHDGGRMMDDYAALARAYGMLHAKHEATFAAAPAAHAAFLRRYASMLLRAGDRQASRRVLWRALKTAGPRRRALIQWIELEVGRARVDALRRVAAPRRDRSDPSRPRAGSAR
jgi:glycosyltransferase involved in cell wall biosynthesis